MDRIIVSRHPAAIEFIARELGLTSVQRWPNGIRCAGPGIHSEYGDDAWIPVLASATPDDVRGKAVYGNVPLHLAALAAEVHAIEFVRSWSWSSGAWTTEEAEVAGLIAQFGQQVKVCSGQAPRGAEYTLADMDAAGAGLVAYKVVPIAGRTWTAR